MTEPPQDAAPVEYLYGKDYGEHTDFVSVVVRFRITKKTAKRIYYVREETYRGPEIGFVDRIKLETEGKVYRRSGRWWEKDFPVYVEPPEIISRRPGPRSVSELRRAMADAHPDRGGDRDAFQAARSKYLQAKGSGRDPD